MKIQCINSKTFELTDGSERSGQIIYDSLFSYKAHIIMGKDEYEINPSGIFSTTICVTKNGTEVANMQMNWKGHIIISFTNGEEYLVRATGTFLNKFVVENKDHQKLMMFDSDINWSKLSYNYNILFDDKPKDILLILLAAYSANYNMALMSAAM
ncbi:hypothetical protein ACFQZS_01300 [Mucilaginibacter calamicampi]|uniref:Uncharacterized protein n=1 Tax=Mucilaginibacter calamicampi TaxID=1302352 RepID=A0ABW2YR03_9SPHI